MDSGFRCLTFSSGSLGLLFVRVFAKLMSIGLCVPIFLDMFLHR